MSPKTFLTSGLALLALAAPASALAASPYEKGPAPTVENLRAAKGPYSYDKKVVADNATPGFGSAAVWYPTNAPGETFGGVAIAPGWTESEAVISWLGPRLASQGFVVITINVNNTFTDLPISRGVQLNAALKYLTETSVAKDIVDPTRLGVVGHSMGGGGVLEAAKRKKDIKATVGLEPWNTDGTWPEIVSPSLIVAAQNDIIAPPAAHAIPFYNTLPATLPKAILNIRGADHFVSNKPNTPVAVATLSWLKRYVDEDTRYDAALGNPPLGVPTGNILAWKSANVG